MRPAEVEKLFGEYAAQVHAAVYRLTLDAAAAEDATQEAFVRLITRPPQKPGNTAAWLKRVAVNCAIDTLRRNGRSKPIGDRDFAAEPEREPSSGELSDEIVEALKRLKPDHRAAVLSVDRDGMSYDDAADLLGVHLNKLKTDLLRGRRALQKALKGTAYAG